MNPIDPRNVRHVLIRANNWIGDVVMISPAVRSIRARFPEARIAILAKSWVLESLRGSPYYDDLIEYDDLGRHRGLAGRLRLVRELRAFRFDLAILFQKAFEAAALAFLAAARHRVGYATDGRSALLTHALPLPPRDMHHADVFLALAGSLGCVTTDRTPYFHLDDESRRCAGTLLADRPDGSRNGLIAVHPGASKEPRSWHPDRFGRLAGALASGQPVRILLLGGPADGPALDRIASHLEPGVVLRPSGRLPIKVMGALLERSCLFIGNDSGPMHVAAALGVPTIGIFGPGSPVRTAPLALPGRLITVGGDYPCSPCRQAFFKECTPAPSGKPFCLEEIEVDEVLEAARTLLSRAPESTA